MENGNRVQKCKTRYKKILEGDVLIRKSTSPKNLLGDQVLVEASGMVIPCRLDTSTTWSTPGILTHFSWLHVFMDFLARRKIVCVSLLEICYCTGPWAFTLPHPARKFFLFHLIQRSTYVLCGERQFCTREGSLERYRGLKGVSYSHTPLNHRLCSAIAASDIRKELYSTSPEVNDSSLPTSSHPTPAHGHAWSTYTYPITKDDIWCEPACSTDGECELLDSAWCLSLHNEGPEQTQAL